MRRASLVQASVLPVVIGAYSWLMPGRSLMLRTPLTRQRRRRTIVEVLAAFLFFYVPSAVAQTCGGVAFGTSASFPAGSGPIASAVGDFDGNGIADVAMANFESADISVFLDDPGTLLGPGTRFPAGTTPGALATGDFNEDTRIDLAVGNRNSRVSILLGTGSGSFFAPTAFPVADSAMSIAVGDLDGDGHSDLAVAAVYSVAVLLGTGTGSFAAPLNFPAGAISVAIAIADFNGDARPDLAVANAGSNNVSILLGTGGGAFAAPANFAVGSSPRSIVAADLNGDGRTDVVVANQDSENVSVLLGTGTGSFGPATNYRSGNDVPALNPTFPNGLAVGDFNRDGRRDLAVSNFGPHNISIFTGTSAGTFAPAIHIPLAGFPRGVAVADLNRDGSDDLIIPDIATDAALILLNTACPAVAAPIPALSPAALFLLAGLTAAVAVMLLRS